MISLELRTLIVKLRNEDKLSIGDISKTVGKSKLVIHRIYKNTCTLGHVKPRNHLAGEDKWIGNEVKKRIDL